MTSVYYEIVELLRDDYGEDKITEEVFVRTLKRLKRSYPSMKDHMHRVLHSYGIYTRLD